MAPKLYMVFNAVCVCVYVCVHAACEEDDRSDDGDSDCDSNDSEDGAAADAGGERTPEEFDSDIDGGAPTPKRRKLASGEGLILSLSSGRYPNYLGIEGPHTSLHPGADSTLDFLLLLWPNSLVDVIANETNRYAESKGRRLSASRDEIWAFLGIIIEMGFNRQARISDYWSTDSKLGVKDVQACMSLNRFWSIWSNLHVVDNSTLSPGDGLGPKIKPVLDVLEKTFFENYSPGQELSVDEAMIKYKGRVKKGKVKMPKKPIKEGFKVWCCCCACCGYLCTFQVYAGKL